MTMRARAGQPVLIIEIGSHWLKMLDVTASRSGIRLARLHVSRFERFSDDLSPTIAKVLKGWKIGKTPVLACLPRTLATVHSLEMPSVDPAEIADMVDFQAARQTPYSKDEILYDYRLAGSDRSGYTRVMLVIVQRSVLRQRFHVMEEAGLEPERMTISSEGLLSAAGAAGGSKSAGEPTAVLDVDAHYSDFMVVTGGRPVYSRSILVGADLLAADPDAARLKLLEEIRRSLELSRAENAAGPTPGRLTVSGACPAELREFLAEGLAVPCEARDPLTRIKKWPPSFSREDPALQAFSLAAPLGLAAAPDKLEINLIPDVVRQRRELIRKARLLTTFGLWLVTVLVSVSLFATVKFFLLKARRDALRTAFQASEPARMRIERMRAVASKARAYDDTRTSAARVLAETHPLIPADIFLDSLEYDGERLRVLLSGTGGTIQDVRALVRNLEGAALFRDVKEEGSTTKDARTGRFRFRVACSLAGGDVE